MRPQTSVTACYIAGATRQDSHNAFAWPTDVGQAQFR
jgi:hypothetical protein